VGLVTAREKIYHNLGKSMRDGFLKLWGMREETYGKDSEDSDLIVDKIQRKI
jgi:hypothetical protein